MADSKSVERSRYVQDMFDRIAKEYDLMNRLMTAGQDILWRKEVVQRIASTSNGWILDLGVGTGDLALEALKQLPTSKVVGVDFSREMLLAGKRKMAEEEPLARRMYWVTADAKQLPFTDDTFNAVVSGFLLRNMEAVGSSLAEQYRLLKYGGKIVALDTTPPRKNMISPLIRFYLHTLIPALGRLFVNQIDAYRYLPDTTENFLAAEILADRLRTAGFKDVGFRRLMFGTIAIHWGYKY